MRSLENYEGLRNVGNGIVLRAGYEDPLPADTFVLRVRESKTQAKNNQGQTGYSLHMQIVVPQAVIDAGHWQRWNDRLQTYEIPERAMIIHLHTQRPT